MVQQNREGWEEEARLAIKDIKKDPRSSSEGIVIRKRLQLMMYNDMFGIMFNRRFESVEDPLFKQLTALNAERSRLSQSFDYIYGDFFPVLRPFISGHLKQCYKLKDARLKFFEDHFVKDRK